MTSPRPVPLSEAANVWPDGTPHHDKMILEGWRFVWEPSTYYVCARHPRGGLQSILEIRNPDFRYLGPAIADMMNQSCGPTVDNM